MALTAVTTLDIPGGNQIIAFDNPAQVDKITFSNNHLTYATAPTFDLSKTDFLLYFSYLNIYNTALILNFPIINTALSSALPLCEFDIKVGSSRITYTQSTNGSPLMTLTYFLITKIMTFSARASDITTSIQEFFVSIYELSRFTKEIGLN